MRKTTAALVGVASFTAISAVQAASLDDYLIVGRQINESTVDASNYELGRISTLDAGNYQAINNNNGNNPDPGVGVGPSIGTTYDAKVAIVEDDGWVKMSNINMYGTGSTGIDCSGTVNDCVDGDLSSNLSNVNYDSNDGNGLSPITAGDGIVGGVDLSGVLSDIATVQDWIANDAVITGSIDTDDGVIEGDLVVNLSDGLNVFDFTDNGGALNAGQRHQRAKR